MANLPVTCATALRLLLRYEPESGHLYWRERAPAWFPKPGDEKRWNTRLANQRACALKEKNGYLSGTIKNRKYLTHRVIWAIHYGEWPPEHVDHINGIRDDNRLENLRAASCTENNRNQRRNKVGPSGRAGVRWCRHTRRWVVQVRNGSHGRICQTFRSMDEALMAHDKIKRELGYDPEHGKLRA